MFGDKNLEGFYTHKVDKKGRIFIPSSTEVEHNDTIIIYLEDSNCIKLFPENTFNEILLKIRENLDQTKNIDELIELRKLIRYISLRSIIVNVDKQHRIGLLNHKFLKNNFQLENNYIEIEGKGDSLVLKPKANN